jgi:sulfur relay (sulfurtransferase) DsrF/TusC family protein
MVKSVVIITDNSPIGKNSPFESIRLGAGFMGLGEDVNCKIVFQRDAVLSLRKNLDPTKLGMDSFAEHLEMAELSDLELFVVEDYLKIHGITADDLVEYEFLKVIPLSEVTELMLQADTTFRM